MSLRIRQMTAAFLGTVIRVVVLIIALVALYRLGAKAYDFGFRIFTEKAMDENNGRDIAFTVSKNDGDSEIAEKLEEKGLIRDKTLFRIQQLITEHAGDIEPGAYTLNTSMNAEQILAVLCKDDSISGETETLSQPDALVEHSDSSITPLGDSSIEDLEGSDWEGAEESSEEPLEEKPAEGDGE